VEFKSHTWRPYFPILVMGDEYWKIMGLYDDKIMYHGTKNSSLENILTLRSSTTWALNEHPSFAFPVDTTTSLLMQKGLISSS